MKESEMKFQIINDEGEAVNCEVLFTYEHDETHKNYIVYTDDTLDENGNTKIYASIYDPNQEIRELQPIETDEEWDMIEGVIGEVLEMVNGEND
ncbi:MAG: DUF1292 domain-containing protein [Clostridia bacterium]|nr:DUF1292 domain-containing protein [Clostridia bacterium]